MVSWDCPQCGGSGKEEVTIMRGGKVTQFRDDCSRCYGAGTFRNGIPELDTFDHSNFTPDW